MMENNDVAGHYYTRVPEPFFSTQMTLLENPKPRVQRPAMSAGTKSPIFPESRWRLAASNKVLLLYDPYQGGKRILAAVYTHAETVRRTCHRGTGRLETGRQLRCRWWTIIIINPGVEPENRSRGLTKGLRCFGVVDGLYCRDRGWWIGTGLVS